MRRSKVALRVVLTTLVGAFVLWQLGPALSEPAAGEKKVKLKVKMPAEADDADLLVDGKKVKSSGAVREGFATLPAGKDTLLVQAVWEPNGYTKITRPRKVLVKADVVEVDLSKQDAVQKDDIVVIFVPTPDDVVEAMCKIAKVGKDDVVYDLGCGNGVMVITAVKKFGAKKGIGIDIDPVRVKESIENGKKAGVADKLE